MCLILFSLHHHPTYKFVLTANRDEFYERKTEPASYWPDHPGILGGKDLEAKRENGTCGTWMAMTTSGKIAMVTNYRDFKNLKSKAPSRGHLVTDFLIRDLNTQQYLHQVEKIKNEYNGFNLLVGDVDNLFYLSNYKDGIEKILPGSYGLSNHVLNTPWPKVSLAKSKMEDVLKNAILKPEQLFEMMRDETHFPYHQLPDTGIGMEREKALSSMFIKTDGYGTRCSTVVLVKHSGETIFSERTYNLNDFSFETKSFEFKVD